MLELCLGGSEPSGQADDLAQAELFQCFRVRGGVADHAKMDPLGVGQPAQRVAVGDGQDVLAEGVVGVGAIGFGCLLLIGRKLGDGVEVRFGEDVVAAVTEVVAECVFDRFRVDHGRDAVDERDGHGHGAGANVLVEADARLG